LLFTPTAVVLLDNRHGVAEERRHLADWHSLTQQVARERVTETMRVPVHSSRIVHDSRIPEQLQKTPLSMGYRRLQFSVAGPEPSGLAHFRNGFERGHRVRMQFDVDLLPVFRSVEP